MNVDIFHISKQLAIILIN